MGFWRENFGWVVGLADKPIDAIDVEPLMERLRSAKRLQAKWEREILSKRQEYDDLFDAKKNVNRSPIERKLNIQKARIVARSVQELTAAVTMLYKMTGMVDKIAQLKKFYEDMKVVGQLPKGMSIHDLMKQVDKLGRNVEREKEKLDEIGATMDQIQVNFSAVGPDSSETAEMDQLFERLQTLEADGRGESEEAAEVRTKIDRLMKIPAI